MLYVLCTLVAVFYILTSYSQVHIQQIGQRELKRAPELAQKHLEFKKREKALMQQHGVKASL